MRTLVQPGKPRTAVLGLAVLGCAVVGWWSLQGTGATPGVIGMPHRGHARAPARAAKTQTAAAPSAHDPRALPDDYHVLLERSIFAPNAEVSGAPHHKQNDKARPMYALRGVMQDGANLTAFVEDTSAGTIARVHAGDAIGAGRVQDISLQSIVIESSGRQQRVEIGEGLGGGPGPGADAAAPPALAGTDAPGDHR